MSGSPTSDGSDPPTKGEFKRGVSSFREWVTANGTSGFKSENGRYHLYAAYACPWASRTLVMRKLKGLEDAITVNIVDYQRGESSWKFSPEKEGCTPDTVNNCKTLKEVYELASPGYAGRYTVPVLFDKNAKKIINNESSEIIRMLNSEFNAFCKTKEHAALDFYPKSKKAEIDELNSWIYPMINNGVYKAGFAQSQEAYDVAVKDVFDGLEKVETILEKKRYLTGSELTEADIRLFVTLVRFDQAYHVHFKCNKKQILNYPNLWPYTRDIYQTDGIRETVNMHHIKHGYMNTSIRNPFGIVAVGPDTDFEEPHGRENVGK